MGQLIENLRAVVGHDSVLTSPEELLVYECDGLPQHKHPPRAVVFPNSTEEVSEALRIAARAGVNFSPRGAGTGLSGGALALGRGIIIEMARMRRLLKLDTENRVAVVQTGLVNLKLSRAAAPYGLQYIPDPSSQMSCTIGGNIAENAGGIHCLKYGTTVDHVLAARVVLSGGDIIELVDVSKGAPGYDLLGVFIGSEGTFGIATEATLRLVPLAPAVRTLLADFMDVDDGSRAVSAIIAAGIIPAALEMIDAATIRAVEASVLRAGLPTDAAAALIVELDGLEAGLDEEAARAEAILIEHGAREVRRARDEIERKKIWAARKGAFGAMGRISPDLMIQDAVVPRSRLPEILAATYQVASKYNLRIANVFHAGDGNLHPIISFDSRSADEVRRVREAGREIMQTCVSAGGSITGEHGVGFDKSSYLPLIFSDTDMETMLRVRAAFDPTGLCNPGKIIPASRTCGEGGAAARMRSLGEDGNGTRGREDAEVRGEEEAAADKFEISNLEISDSKIDESEINGNEGAAIHQAPLRDFAQASAQVAASVPTTERTPAHVASSSCKVSANSLAQIVGAENVGAAEDGVLTIAPASDEEACESLRMASSEGWKVAAAGAQSWPKVGNLAPRADFIISTRRMNRIIEHEPADLISRAEAGATLSALNDELARAGQWLPLDPPDDGRATIGGVAATGLSGAHGFGYGAPRGFIIGMKVALADGRRVKAGGRVVKNVAGYDLCKLFTGSYGTLGLILELTFKLRPLPAEMRTLIATGPRAELLELARAIVSSNLLPVALEQLSAQTARALALENTKQDCALLMRFSGNSEAVKFQIESALVLTERAKEVNPVNVLSDDAGLWEGLAALPLKQKEHLIWRASMKPSELAKFIESLSEAGEASLDTSALWHASLGDGRLRVMTPITEDINSSVATLTRLRSLAQAAGGALVVEEAPDDLKESFDVWGDVGARLALMRRVKEQLDPQSVFAPGRFVAGI